MQKAIMKLQDEGEIFIHCKQHPKTWLSYVEGINENAEFKDNYKS